MRVVSRRIVRAFNRSGSTGNGTLDGLKVFTYYGGFGQVFSFISLRVIVIGLDVKLCIVSLLKNVLLMSGLIKVAFLFLIRAFFNSLLRAVPFLRNETPFSLLKTPKTHAI